MTVIINGGAGITFPDTVQQTNAITNTGGNPRYYAARAWVSFDGSTTPPTILSASNVASVSTSGTGLFTVTFTTNMPTARYAVSGAALSTTRSIIVSLRNTPTVSSFDIRVTDLSGSTSSPTTNPFDSTYISLVIFA